MVCSIVCVLQKIVFIQYPRYIWHEREAWQSSFLTHARILCQHNRTHSILSACQGSCKIVKHPYKEYAQMSRGQKRSCLSESLKGMLMLHLKTNKNYLVLKLAQENLPKIKLTLSTVEKTTNQVFCWIHDSNSGMQPI